MSLGDVQAYFVPTAGREFKSDALAVGGESKLPQAKRIQESSMLLDALTPQNNVFLSVPSTPREMVNFHNLWFSVSCEPQQAGANGNGVWVLSVVPVGVAVPTWSLANILTESFNQYVLACGTATYSNESTFNLTETLGKTSRTLNPGDSIFLSFNQQGLTAGQTRNLLLLCAQTTRK